MGCWRPLDRTIAAGLIIVDIGNRWAKATSTSCPLDQRQLARRTANLKPSQIMIGISALISACLVVTPTALATSHASQPGAASSGVAVAGGTVTSASGTAMAGQSVDLYAWPSDAVLQALKPGRLVPTALLAATTTSSAGKYTLKVPAATLKAAAVESGYANLEIYSPLGGMWFFSYQASSLPAQPSAPAIVNLSAKIKGVHCGVDDLNRPLAFTGFAKQKQLNPANAIVGQGYVVQRGIRPKAMSYSSSTTGLRQRARLRRLA